MQIVTDMVTFRTWKYYRNHRESQISQTIKIPKIMEKKNLFAEVPEIITMKRMAIGALTLGLRITLTFGTPSRETRERPLLLNNKE